MSTTWNTRKKMMAMAVAASMILGAGSMASPAFAGKKKSKSAKASTKMSNTNRQSNRQSQNATVNGGDGGDSGRVTCVSALNGNNVGAGVGVLALLFGPPATQQAGGGQACSSGAGGAGGGNNNAINQDQAAGNAVVGNQTNDGGTAIQQ